jgi:hypothetical protein
MSIRIHPLMDLVSGFAPLQNKGIIIFILYFNVISEAQAETIGREGK